MKINRIIGVSKVVSFLLIMMISFNLFAQQGGKGGDFMKATPEERAKRLTEMMKEKLKLTPAQEPKVSAINLKYAKKNEEIKKISDTATQRKTLRDNNKLKDTELKGVLTPEQFASYLKLAEEMKSRRRGMKP
jgi:Spy/CpxP family protein refolding chaperone